MSNKPRLCFVTAVPMTVIAFLNAHIERLANDYDVYVIADFSQGTQGVSTKAKYISVAIARDIAISHDIQSLWQLVGVFRQYQFDIVLSVTPKAGLIATMAGLFARIPVRIHWFTGQVWVTRQGIMRQILKMADSSVAMLATHLLADSPSQRQFLIDEKIGSANKISVIAKGSICGVNGLRFKPNSEARQQVFALHHIADDAKVVLFVGRLNVDKGLRELAQAIPVVAAKVPNVIFLIVGPDEGNMVAHIQQVAADWLSHIRFQGFTSTPELYMAAADIFCLPSYREGFGSSVLEAAACGVPAIATRIYGLTDAVEEDVTGVLVAPQNSQALAQALIQLLINTEQCQMMGKQAQHRATTEFALERVSSALAQYLAQTLRK